jgi:hypothetical protein
MAATDMSKAFQKLLRKVFLKKYPSYLDAVVNEVNYSEKLTPYFEVFLLIREEKFNDDVRDSKVEIDNFIRTLGKYMGIIVYGVYNEVLSSELSDDDIIADWGWGD